MYNTCWWTVFALSLPSLQNFLDGSNNVLFCEHHGPDFNTIDVHTCSVLLSCHLLTYTRPSARAMSFPDHAISIMYHRHNISPCHTIGSRQISRPVVTTRQGQPLLLDTQCPLMYLLATSEAMLQQTSILIMLSSQGI